MSASFFLRAANLALFTPAPADMPDAMKYLSEQRVSEDSPDFYGALYWHALASMLAGDPSAPDWVTLRKETVGGGSLSRIDTVTTP